MGSESGGSEINEVSMEKQGQLISSAPYYLEKFTLYETPSNFYMIGRDEERKRWRVLKISRSEPSELVVYEDPTVYSFVGCKLLLEDINDLHKLTGGHKFVTNCYGIVGFIRFLGPYYIIIITKRKEIGKICGHPVYAISEYKMIPIAHSTVWSYMDNFEIENRYKKLLCLVDITKDFFFSYSYPIMSRLQKNLCQETGQSSDGKIFVWNEYLTRQIRNHLKNTLWTVALVHGFFKQVELSLSGNTFSFTLIARRSCQFAGTRYQRRGINDEGQAANEVEIEQIVFKEIHGECPYKVTSCVQKRGSIPLFWSQRPSLLNLRPDILLSEGNSYEATQRHFQNLQVRYGDPIIILNLVKTCEKKPRESILNEKFLSAVDCINTDSPRKDKLKFWTLDVDAVFRRKGTDVLTPLKENAAMALEQIGFFSGQIHQVLTFKASFDLSYSRTNNSGSFIRETNCSDSNHKYMHQNGILRTNCLDSLDRTNVAQFVYSWVALGHQLVELELTASPDLDFKQTLAYDIMGLCETMGDALAQQYGGSAAHSKIFSKIRGQWRAATQIWEFMKTMQRHFSNSFRDADKQAAIDLFLGNIKPEDCGSAPLETILGRTAVLEGSLLYN